MPFSSFTLPDAQFHSPQVPAYLGEITERCERGGTVKANCANWRKGRWGG